MTSPIPSQQTMQTIYVCNQGLVVLERVKAFLASVRAMRPTADPLVVAFTQTDHTGRTPQ